jgi:hypothetical protein
VATNYLEGAWNPARVITALGRIGYHPASAILDITDNSVSAHASKILIEIHIEQEQREGQGRRRAVLSGVSITDNGDGMDPERLADALSLGSSADYYPAGTLSKFGLGLKSAAGSLGKRLSITSRGEGGQAHTVVLDHDVVNEQKKYVYESRDATQDETSKLDKVTLGKRGTMVEITKIHEQAMPSPAEIIQRLKDRTGVIYYFALSGLVPNWPKVCIRIKDEEVAPRDPLFQGETGKSDLDEHNWDGLSVCWIQKPQNIQLTDDGKVTAKVTMTQLPHPPSVAKNSNLSQAQARTQYMIGAGNYGFYIYRNGRLIAWADSLGMVSQDQDLYSFRGRLEITSDADDVLNIDVTKSRLHLSSIARVQLLPLVQEALKKSRIAWNSAKRTTESQIISTPHDEINEQLNKVGKIEEKSDELDEEAAPADERKELQKRRAQATSRKPASGEESDRLRNEAQRVQYVPMLANNQLWERAHDSDLGLIVRVNSSHRLIREIVELQRDNSALVKSLDIIFFGLARGEYDLVYKSDHDASLVESVIDEYRERVGSELTEIIRQIDVTQAFPG